MKRQIAVATAQAYLLVIAAHRVVESQMRARDTAQAFYDYAAQRLQAGAGSRLTALQAQQTLSADQALVEVSSLALFRAQEALGVLVTSDRPLDAVDEPAFEIPEESGDARGSGSRNPAASRHQVHQPSDLCRAARRQRQLEGLDADGERRLSACFPGAWVNDFA